MTDLGSALCDPHQLANANLNLCINARDAMPDVARLTIETAGATLNTMRSYVTVSLCKLIDA